MVKPIVLSLAVALGVCQPVAFAQDCSSRPYCTEMRSCAEADFYFGNAAMVSATPTMTAFPAKISAPTACRYTWRDGRWVVVASG